MNNRYKLFACIGIWMYFQFLPMYQISEIFENKF